jgi:hypothetical protein
MYDTRERLPAFLIGTPLGDQILPAIVRHYPNDPMVQNGIRRPFKWHREFVVLDDPSITENLRLYIPNGNLDDDDPNTDIRKIFIVNTHLTTGHQGSDKLYIECRKYFYWPGMKKDVDEYCPKCLCCGRNKDSTTKPIGEPPPMDIPLRPWESIAIDFLGPFPSSNGFRNIMVVMD